MFKPTGEESRKVMALASRLRLVQAELADERPEVRQEQLDGEIERVLVAIQPGEREAFLQDLMRSFPGGNLEPVRVNSAAPTAAVGPALPKDPVALADVVTEMLVKAWGSLKEDQRKSLTAKLSEAGVMPAPAGGEGGSLPEGVVRDLRRKLEIQPTESPDAARLAELAVLVMDFVIYVDKLVWGSWQRRIAPMAALRANGPMQRFLKEYVLGKFDPLQSATAGASGELRRLQEMTYAVVGAIGSAGRTFGERFESQFSPATIEELVGEAGFARNKDAECWKKYKEAAGKLDRLSIEADVTQTIARAVEESMRRNR